MRFADYNNEIKRHLADVTAETLLAIEMAVNNCYFQIWNKANWWFARREYYFDTVAKYTTGTVSVTQYSATVTGSGTTFTSAMIGRKLVVGSDNTGYIIKSVESTTSLTLDTVYLDDAKSGSAYAIYKHIYRLNDRVMKILWAINDKDRKKLWHYDERKFDTVRPYCTTNGTPTHYIPRGQTTAPYYNTGTVAVTSGSKTVTGTGFEAAMINMVFKVVGDDMEYIISAVPSATTLTLNINYDGTTSASASYEIGPTGTEQIELYPAPDIVMQVKYKGQLRPLKLRADNDVPELPQQWHEGILLGALAKVLPGRAVDNSEITYYRNEYALFLQDIMDYHNLNEDENPIFEDNLRDQSLEDEGWRAFRN